MAYIDDNNLSSGNGKDPLTELDEELEKLMSELKEMEEATANDDAPLSEEPSSDEKDSFSDQKDEEKKAYREAYQPIAQPQKPKKRGRIPVVILVVILIAGVAAGGVWLVNRLLSAKIGDIAGKSDSKVETVAFTDSELGEITVKKVDGAALNTYDTDNLVKNDNGYYEYIIDGKVTSEVGIDLAEYQGDIDFGAVKDSGVDYVILRIGGRYYSEDGVLYEDGRFDEYYEQAKSAGLKVGAYFFSQAADTDEAVVEAEYVIEKLSGRSLDYPVAFDWETIEDDSARTDYVDGATITAMAEAFCDTIKDKGYQSIVYASTSLMLQSYDFETMKDYEFWLADYREFPNMYYDFAMWQYQTDGTVSGIDGEVDLNICFKPY